MRGVDYSWGRPDLATLYSEGYRFVARYLSWGVYPQGKVLTSDEATAIHAHGLDIVLVWEFDARDAMGGFISGQVMANEAERQRKDLGAPADVVIYFAVDFDATAAELATVERFFHGVAEVLPLERIGVYAGIRTVTYLADRQLVGHAWQTYAWSLSKWAPFAQLRQVRNGVTVAGADCDLDESLTDHFGQWRAGTDMTFTDDDGARLTATDNRVREILLKGSDVYDDVPGEGPSQRPWLVAEVKAIHADIAQLRAELAARPLVALSDADRSAIAASVLGGLTTGVASQGFARLVAGAVLDAMSARLGQ